MINSRPAMLSTATLLLLATAAGCTRTQAKVVPEPPPPLEIPAPPPRMVEPVLAEAPESADPNAGMPAGTIEAKPTPPTQPRPPRPEPPRVETPTDTGPDTQKPPQNATLQTIPPEKEGQQQRQIRVHLDTAVANLNRVDYRMLSADGRANFDQARRFIAQAEEALRAKNFMFAKTVADKAVTLAAQLAGR